VDLEENNAFDSSGIDPSLKPRTPTARSWRRIGLVSGSSFSEH
jgi:hypothetical protein